MFSVSLKGAKKKKKTAKDKSLKRALFQDDNEHFTVKKTKIMIDKVENLGVELRKEDLVIKPVPIHQYQASSLLKFSSGQLNETNGDKRSKTSNTSKIADENSSKSVDGDEAVNTYIESLPEAPKEDEYDEVPVEEFGDALLRGMGWDGQTENDSKTDKNQSKNVMPHLKARAQYAGVGSTIPADTNASVDDDFMPLIQLPKK